MITLDFDGKTRRESARKTLQSYVKMKDAEPDRRIDIGYLPARNTFT